MRHARERVLGTAAGLADAALEATVAGSFTRIGFRARRRLYGWRPLADIAAESGFAGSRVVITGATSGIGAAAAARLASLGAELHIVGRDPQRTETAARQLAGTGDTPASVTPHVADLRDLCAVAAFCDTFSRDHSRLDVLIHNAGALVHDYSAAPGGHEETYTAQVLGPQLMKQRLLPLLTPRGRVLVVSSGGMYAEPLAPDRMEMGAADYDGVRAYARAKRAQVELVAEWARRFGDTGVTFQAMHPGWADTPGVRTSLPGFHRVTRLALRDADEGADTLVWLAVSPEATTPNGSFWLDRRKRGTTRIPFTGSSQEQRSRLWELVDRQVYSAVEACPGSRDQNSRRLSTT